MRETNCWPDNTAKAIEVGVAKRDISSTTSSSHIYLDPMKSWPTLEYDRATVAAAGKMVAEGEPEWDDFFDLELEERWNVYSAKIEEYTQALKVMNNWRAAHGYPLNTFQMRLRNCSRKVYPHALVSQRIKRVVSIVAKINEMKMKLPTMQDIAGCRAIVETVAQVRKLHSDFYSFDLTTGDGLYEHHKGKKVSDYISNPKSKTGYRSLHLVFEYCSEKDLTYNGLKIEVQLRTKLQHAWSTAVETVQRFTGQELKAGRGEEDWKDFFKLTSSAFALVEGTPVVEGITNNPAELRNEIKAKMRLLNVEEALKGFSGTIKISKEREKKEDDHYYLLVFEPQEGKSSLQILPYRRDEYRLATRHRNEHEKRLRGRPLSDVVLVSVPTLRDLRRAFPNYYLDTTFFIESVRKFLSSGAAVAKKPE